MNCVVDGEDKCISSEEAMMRAAKENPDSYRCTNEPLLDEYGSPLLG